jgi:hypothetical protein
VLGFEHVSRTTTALNARRWEESSKQKPKSLIEPEQIAFTHPFAFEISGATNANC